MIKQNELSFPKMKERISRAGNLFYQYRACRRDAATIYDIENIRHGVVYARTPLQMNDPFDSMIGFSADKIYEECIDLVLNQVAAPLDPDLKSVLKILIKHRLVGKTVGFIDALNKLKRYIFTQSIISHAVAHDLQQFILRNNDQLYRKCPGDIKKYFNKQLFLFFSLFIKDYQNVEIEEKTITDAFQMEDALNALEANVIEIRDQKYLPFIKDFLSKLTVACFSASGWDNQLMWSHYANSYSGICVEYDFEKMNKFIGFMYPVEYSSDRPTLALKDLGFSKYLIDENGSLNTGEPDLSAIFSYLLTKNKCWEYEDEWRIINTGEEPYTPKFVDISFVKSITLGLNVDELCKQLLWDVCQEKGIDCYQLVVSQSDYSLDREILTTESFAFDEARELEYINLLSSHIISLGEKMSVNSQAVVAAIEKGSFEASAMINVLTFALDFLSDAYFFKASFNRYCKNMNVQETDIASEPQIISAISQINDVISISKSGAESMEESIIKLRIASKISTNDYHTAKRLTSNIKEMVERHCKLGWFGGEIQVPVPV